MYEIEIKVEVSEQEREAFIRELERNKFTQKDPLVQNDHYVAAKKSPYGGYDLERYRDENGVYMYTKKVWELAQGTAVRREDEHEVDQQEFDQAVEAAMEKISIQKKRQSFEGMHEGKRLKVDMDSIKFDHSPEMRHFIEAEIVIADKEGSKYTKEFLRSFLKALLHRDELIESPGMFTMAFEKR